MKVIVLALCSMSCVLAQQHPIGRDRSARGSFGDSGSRQFAPQPPSAIIPSRQTSTKVTFQGDDNRENSLNHIDGRFQEQRLQDNIPQPYDFGYSIQDEYGNNQYRQETGDQGGVVRGSYGYTDALGIYRKVKYIADAAGFRAEVSSNEPGMKAESPASASFLIEPSPQSLQNVGGFPSPPASSSGSDQSQRRFPASRRFSAITSAASSPASASAPAAVAASDDASS